jgi:ribose-phosphate pyrophosphokinase
MFCTFAFLTKGPEPFDIAFKEGLIKRLYTTNLNYIPEETLKRKWLVRVDFSYFLAQIINTLYHHEKISPLMNGKEEIQKKINEKIEKNTH